MYSKFSFTSFKDTNGSSNIVYNISAHKWVLLPLLNTYMLETNKIFLGPATVKNETSILLLMHLFSSVQFSHSVVSDSL